MNWHVCDIDAFTADLAAHGLGARDVARLSGISNRTVLKVFKGKLVRESTLGRIFNAIGKVPVRNLAGES
jgi:predicted transcriptional regulator